MRGIIVAASLIAAFVAAGCSRQESAWRAARREDTAAAYAAFLARHPAGPRAAEARAALGAIRDDDAWARADRLATPEAWQRYLGEFPDGRHAAAARGLLIAFIPPEPAPDPAAWVVQLGAWSTEAAARAGMADASARHGADLAAPGLGIVAPAAAGGGTWRLRTGAIPEAQARELCARLRSRGVDCVPLPCDSAGNPAP